MIGPHWSRNTITGGMKPEAQAQARCHLHETWGPHDHIRDPRSVLKLLPLKQKPKKTYKSSKDLSNYL